MAAYRFTQHLPREKQAMKMTEYGKHGKPRSRPPSLPALFGNPSGIAYPEMETTRFDFAPEIVFLD
jgi:hypothetical protein